MASHGDGNHLEWLYSELHALKERLDDANARLKQKEAARKKEQARGNRLKAELDAIRSSWSWRAGSILRRVERLTKQWSPAATKPAAGASSDKTALMPQPSDRTVSTAGSAGEHGSFRSETDGLPQAATGSAASSPASDLKRAWERQAHLALGNFLETGSTLDFTCTADPPDVSVLLVLFNRAELTLHCLQSLQTVLPGRLQLVLVDNASEDATAQLLNRLRGAVVFRNTENLHYLAGCNQAAAAATGRHLLFLNNDTRVFPGSVEQAMAILDADPSVGAVGGRLILPDGTLQEAGSVVWADGSCAGLGRGEDPAAPQWHFRRDTDYCSAAFLMTPRPVFEALGGYDPAYSPAYYEETDFCMRLRAAGQRVVYDPRVAVLHYEFASSAVSDEAIALQRRNRGIFVQRHAHTLGSLHPPGTAQLEARHRARQPRVLFIEDRVPHRFLGAGYPRAFDLVTALLEHGVFLTLYPMGYPSEDFPAIYRDIPPQVEVMTGLRKSGLHGFLQGRTDYYDLIIVSRPHNHSTFVQTVAEQGISLRAPVAYDAEAIFSDRTRARKSLGLEPDADPDREFAQEMDLARKADLIAAVSARDALRFHEATGKPAVVVGHRFDIEPTPPNLTKRSGLLFAGPVHTEETPNADSARWLHDRLRPLVHAQGITIRWAGLNKSPLLQGLNEPGFEALGAQDSLRPLYESARVFVAPTRFAAGLPLKVHEAAAHGVPVVATPLLAEQLGWVPERDLLVAVEPEEFAAACRRLCEDDGLWQRVRASALERVREETAPDHFRASVGELLKAGGVPI